MYYSSLSFIAKAKLQHNISMVAVSPFGLWFYFSWATKHCPSEGQAKASVQFKFPEDSLWVIKAVQAVLSRDSTYIAITSVRYLQLFRSYIVEQKVSDTAAWNSDDGANPLAQDD